jgi:hypothetical protein
MLVTEFMKVFLFINLEVLISFNHTNKSYKPFILYTMLVGTAVMHLPHIQKVLNVLVQILAGYLS